MVASAAQAPAVNVPEVKRFIIWLSKQNSLVTENKSSLALLVIPAKLQRHSGGFQLETMYQDVQILNMSTASGGWRMRLTRSVSSR